MCRRYEVVNDTWEWDNINFIDIKKGMVIRAWDTDEVGNVSLVTDDSHTEFLVTREPYKEPYPDVGIAVPLGFDGHLADMIDVEPAGGTRV